MPQTRLTRWSAARFVIVFLVLTVMLLSAGRYAVNSPAMNWYLFQVARQTAFMLRVVGDDCYVEAPSAYESRAALMRAEMEAWRHGNEPNEVSEGANAAPLSAYEIWQHRALKQAHDLRVEQKHFHMTDPLSRPVDGTFEDYVAYLRAGLKQLNASATRGEGPIATHVAANGVKEIVETTGISLSIFESGTPPPAMPIDAIMAESEAKIEQGRVAQREFLDERVRKITAQIQEKLGPQVTFIAREDHGSPLRFTFSLVPDCGALPSMSIYFAALVAFPASLRKRALGLLIGVPILYVINLARLSCLSMIGAYWRNEPQVFEFAHQYVWQAIYVLVVVGVWLLWVELVVRPGTSWRTNPTSAA